MRQNMKVGAIALALVAVMGLAAVGVGVNQVWAQATTGTATAAATDASAATTTVTDTTTARMPNPVRQAGLDAAAKILGMSTADLTDQLWGGKTLADLATEKNVKLSDLRTAVQDATKAARLEQFKTMIAKQLADGKITQEHADWLNQGIDNGWLGGGQMAGGLGMNSFGGFGNNDMGMGMGMGGARGMNHRMQAPKQTPDQSDSSDQQK